MIKNTALPAPRLLESIGTAMDLLEAAGGLFMLREILAPKSCQYEHASRDLRELLTQARVAVADAISKLEEEDA